MSVIWRDSVGTNHLTPSADSPGTVNRGPVGTVASFVAANNEYLEKSSVSLDYHTTGYTFATWVKLSSVSGNKIPFMMGDSWADTTTGTLLIVNTFASLRVSNGTDYLDTEGGALALEADKWYLLVGWFDPADAKPRLQYNNGQIDVSTTALTGTLATSTNVGFGRFHALNSAYHDGKIGPTALWGRVLTSDERTSLFNSGNGKRYADLTTAEKVGLVSYWDLDEVSGNRADSHGSNTLTDNATVGSVNTGPLGTVANFANADDESLSTASIASPSGSWAWTGWFYTTDPNLACQGLFSRANTSGWPNNTSGIMYIVPSTGDDIALQGFVGDGSALVAVDSASLPINTWHFVATWYDSSDKKIRLSVNGGTAVASAALSGTFYTANTPIYLGYSPNHADSTIAGKMARSGMWSRTLETSDITSLFNGGLGKSYADLTAAEKVGLVSYWNLDEASGNRADSHGANTLTDNATVMSVINASPALDGAAASFVRANSEVLSGGKISLTGDHTVSVWAKTTSTAGDGIYSLFTNGNYNTIRQDELYIGQTNGFPVFNVHNTSGTEYTASVATDYGDGNWHLWIATFDTADSKARLYIDNILVGTSGAVSGALEDDSDVSSWGALTTSHYMQGQMDEPAIWSRVLTADERARLFALGKGKFYDFS